MRNLFGRRSSAATLPAGATETWDEAAGAVVIHVPVRTERPEDHESADRLTTAIVQAVDAINAGNVGHDVIPENASAPTARVVLEPTHRDLGPLEVRTVEIFQERLGVAIPLEHVPGANPPSEDDEAEAVEEAPVVEMDDDGQTVELPPIGLAWAEDRHALTAQLEVPLTTSDGASRRALGSAMDALFAALRDPALGELVPAGATAAYVLSVSFAPGAVVGPATIALQEQIDAQLAGTALTVEVIAD